MKKVAIAYSSKNRLEFTKQTLPPVLAEVDKFDLYWVDGSDQGSEAQAYVNNFTDNTAKAFLNIGGGADVAIVFALSKMLEGDYEYIGLVENDVLLESGWFDKIFSLFDTPGLRVGSVSARCLSDRILIPRKNYAVMANIGAGMVIFKRDAARVVLDYYRTSSYNEFAFLTEYYTGVPCPKPHELNNPNSIYNMTADWLYESSLMGRGYSSLAVTPSMARNIDQDDDKVQLEPTFEQSGFLWNKYLNRSQNPGVQMPLGNYDPCFKYWTAQSHQIMDAVPDSYAGGWRLSWERHNGPFGMVTTKGDETLSIPLYGSDMGILVDANGQEAVIQGRIKNGTATLNLDPTQKGLQWVKLHFEEYGNHQLELSFDRPGITLATLGFDVVQAWFKDGYDLSYDLIKPFIHS